MIDMTDYFDKGEVLFEVDGLAFVYTGAECYYELVVRDNLESPHVTAIFSFDQHDHFIARGLGEALIKYAESMEAHEAEGNNE
jgi:hypothetical protein